MQPKHYFESITIANTEQAIKINTPPLAMINKEEGALPTLAMLVIILGSVVRFFSVGRTVNDMQLAETAKLILSEYYFLKIEDLKLCFDRMKKGYYGETYDRMDGNVILVALKKYTEERIDIAERLSLESHKELTDAQKQERYFIKIGENYIHETDTEIIEVERKEIATDYDFNEAIKVKNKLINDYTVLDAKIVYSNKADIGFIDYLKENKPELAKEIEAIGKEKETGKFIRTHAIQTAQIEASEMTELERENAKRAIVYLKPITQKEFDMRKEVYK